MPRPCAADQPSSCSAKTETTVPTIVGGSRLDGALGVEVVPPTLDGGSPITSYILRATSTEPDVFQTVDADGVAALQAGQPRFSATVSGLTNGVEYTITVRACRLSARPFCLCLCGAASGTHWMGRRRL